MTRTERRRERKRSELETTSLLQTAQDVDGSQHCVSHSDYTRSAELDCSVRGVSLQAWR